MSMQREDDKPVIIASPPLANPGDWTARVSSLHPAFKALLGGLMAALVSVLLIQVREHLEPRHALISFTLLAILTAYVIGPSGALAAGCVSLLAFALYFVPPMDTPWLISPADAAVLVGFATVVLLEAYLATQLRRRTTESENSARRSNFAARISAMLVEHRTEFDVEGELMRTLAVGTGARGAYLYRYDDAADTLTPFSEPDPEMDALARAVADRGTALGDPALNALAGEYPGAWPEFVEPPAGSRGVGIPVETGERLEGVLCLAPSGDRAFEPGSMRLAVVSARLIATALERLRLENVAAERKAEASAQRLKAVFMSSVSHELKSPLAALEAITSDWSADESLSGARVQRDIPIVRRAVERLTDNITDLLNLTRLQGDAIQTRLVACETGDVVARAIEYLDEPLRSRVDPDVASDPILVMCDYDQLSRALSSIMRNALAYGGPGRIRVGSSVEAGAVKLWVEDEGPGIDPAERPRIFEPFYRGEKTKSSVAGSGVGLAIAREVVRYHGGEVHVEDVDPHGSRFVLTLPEQSESAE